MRPYSLAEMMAERVGFEPTCPLRDKTLSRRPRYDHFGTSPSGVMRANRTLDYNARAAVLLFRQPAATRSVLASMMHIPPREVSMKSVIVGLCAATMLT